MILVMSQWQSCIHLLQIHLKWPIFKNYATFWRKLETSSFSHNSSLQQDAQVRYSDFFIHRKSHWNAIKVQIHKNHLRSYKSKSYQVQRVQRWGTFVQHEHNFSSSCDWTTQRSVGLLLWWKQRPLKISVEISAYRVVLNCQLSNLQLSWWSSFQRLAEVNAWFCTSVSILCKFSYVHVIINVFVSFLQGNHTIRTTYDEMQYSMFPTGIYQSWYNFSARRKQFAAVSIFSECFLWPPWRAKLFADYVRLWPLSGVLKILIPPNVHAIFFCNYFNSSNKNVRNPKVTKFLSFVF